MYTEIDKYLRISIQFTKQDMERLGKGKVLREDIDCDFLGHGTDKCTLEIYNKDSFRQDSEQEIHRDYP